MAKKKKRQNGNGEGTLEKRGDVYFLRYLDIADGKRKRVSTNETNREKAEIFQRNFMAERKLVKSLDDKKTQLYHIQAKLENEISNDEQDLMTLHQVSIKDLWTNIFENEDFVDVRPDVGEMCRSIYKRFTKNFLDWVEANHKDRVKYLGDVTEDMAREFLRHIEVTKSANERNKNFVWMRQAYNFYLTKKLVIKNPFANFKNIQNIKVTKKRILEDDEMKRLLDVLETKDIQTKGVFLFGIETGQRLGDCCCMKWSHIQTLKTKDGEREFLVFMPHKTMKKSQTEVHCPITPKLHDFLEDMKKEGFKDKDGYIFPDWANKYLTCSANADNRVLRIIEEANINRLNEEGKTVVGFHSLRHSFVNRCVCAGLPLTTVMGLVGHKKADMTLHYALHQNINESAKALDVLSRDIGEGTNHLPISKEVIDMMDSMRGEMSYSDFIKQLMDENKKLKSLEKKQEEDFIAHIGAIIDKKVA